MAKTQQQSRGLSDPDPLAAVVLHTLVSTASKGMTIAQLATACERNPADPADVDEIEAAIEVLLTDGLAQTRDDLYQPTRAAIRAAELSF